MHPTSSLLLLLVFTALTLAVVAVVVAAFARRTGHGARAALVALAWLVVTTVLALSGTLLDFTSRPPPIVIVLVVTFVLAVWVALSRIGAALSTVPLWLLVGLQGFRLPLELVMHRAGSEGVMPVVMGFTGRNFDIVAGALAIVVAVLLKRGASTTLAWAWVVLATLTLVNVVVVAVLASPMVRFFGDGELNIWIAYAPFIWLPTVLVAVALAGQIVIVRALRRPPPDAARPHERTRRASRQRHIARAADRHTNGENDVVTNAKRRLRRRALDLFAEKFRGRDLGVLRWRSPAKTRDCDPARPCSSTTSHTTGRLSSCWPAVCDEACEPGLCGLYTRKESSCTKNCSASPLHRSSRSSPPAARVLTSPRGPPPWASR